eukprot:6309519-Pyramimonas_sp.AAC.1
MQRREGGFCSSPPVGRVCSVSWSSQPTFLVCVLFELVRVSSPSVALLLVLVDAVCLAIEALRVLHERVEGATGFVVCGGRGRSVVVPDDLVPELMHGSGAVSYTHLRAHETGAYR